KGAVIESDRRRPAGRRGPRSAGMPGRRAALAARLGARRPVEYRAPVRLRRRGRRRGPGPHTTRENPMKKILLGLLAIVALACVAIVGLAMTKPDTYHVER